MCYNFFMQKKSFTSPIRQTHFIGVLIPENLLVPLEACRAWMRARCGCKSGQGTPLHITLVPPFYLDENFSERTLFEALAEAASAWGVKRQTLCCAVNGFGAFSSRTIFAHVEPSSEKKLSGRNSPFSWRVKLLENFEF